MAKPKTHKVTMTLKTGESFTVLSVLKLEPDYVNAQIVTECGADFVIPVSEIKNLCMVEKLKEGE